MFTIGSRLLDSLFPFSCRLWVCVCSGHGVHGHARQMASLILHCSGTFSFPAQKHSKLTDFSYAMSILIKINEQVALPHIDTCISYEKVTYAIAYQTRYTREKWNMMAQTAATGQESWIQSFYWAFAIARKCLFVTFQWFIFL